MATIRVTHSIGELAGDLNGIAARVRPDMSRVVRKNLKAGTTLAKRYASQHAGPHGKAYHKRISSETDGLLSGEYGPTGIPKTDFVGVGFRSGTNTDLARTTDIIGPAFQRSVHEQVGDWFW